MKYFLVNGSNWIKTSLACTMIKYDLTHWFGKQVEIVNDLHSSDLIDPEFHDLMVGKSLKPHQKLSLILDRRKTLMTDVILPAMNTGKIVLYAGGVLNDTQFIKPEELSFQAILRENLEMLQSIGGVAYPTGAIRTKTIHDCLTDQHAYHERADLLASSVSRFKQTTYHQWQDLSGLIS